MKFEAKEEYTICENLLYTLYTAKGIGSIELKYSVSPKSRITVCWLMVGLTIVGTKESTEETAEKDVIHMYKEFIKNKISSRHVVVKEKGMYRVFDIKTGYSILLTRAAIKKLGAMI